MRTCVKMRKYTQISWAKRNVEETDSAGMTDEMTNGRTERVEAYGQGYQMIVLYCKIA